ncbi:MAG: hypothetical protein MUO58_14590, partial [Anaerolineales bacterium]|nr:hypothetical protein [Anaerolineales bacterium]
MTVGDRHVFIILNVADNKRLQRTAAAAAEPHRYVAIINKDDDLQIVLMNDHEVVERIVNLTINMVKFWQSADGWAPIEASELLSRSRLDWQVSLSRYLVLWLEPPETGIESAWQILGYVNLGSLVEGSMKLFLSVWYKDYQNDIDAIKRKGKLIDPDTLYLE